MNIKKLQKLIDIIDFLSRQHVSIEIIMDHFRLKNRTFFRYKKEIEEDLKIVIDCEKGLYSISNQNHQKEASLKNWLVRSMEYETFSNIQNKEFVILESEDYDENNNIEALPIALQAIHRSSVLSFNYTKYNSTSSNKVEVKPYFVKQYLQRWYLIALKKGENGWSEAEMRSYGFDRISSITITDEKFNRKEQVEFDIKDIYESCIGIFSDSSTEEVILAFSKRKHEYIRKVPFHLSQVVLEEQNDPDWVYFKYNLRPNRDLLNRISFYGNDIKVIQPQSLKDEIKTILATSLSFY